MTFTIKNNRVIIEQNQKLSESYLFQQYQRDYFDRKGIDAWVTDVPHYATSNPFLANCYATIAVRFAQSWVQKNPESKAHPFYIIELGTGSGQLSFYVVKNIKRLQHSLGLTDIKIRYVMTDFTESNLKFWQKHPGLKEFVDDGLLDFGIFDMQYGDAITLRESGETISAGGIQNPLIVYANYLFDTIPQDCYFARKDELLPSLISLSTGKENVDSEGKIIEIENVKVEYTAGKNEDNYYDDDDLNAVLNSYRGKLKNSQFLFPLTGLKSIANLKKFSNGKLLLVTSDKGYSFLEELEGLDNPHLDFHGSFSTMVNFHAIAKYFELTQGGSILQSRREGITTHGFYTGFNLEDYPEMAYTLWENIERLSPGDYFVLHRNIRENVEHCNLNTLTAHMVFTGWDPHIYGKITKRICELAPRGDRTTIEYLTTHMPNLAANFYYMPRQYDVMFDIGILFHTLHRYKEAIPYYEKSRHYFGDKFNLLYNLAICHYHAGEVEEGLAVFKKAQELNPESEETKRFIEYIESKKDKDKKK